MASKAKIIFDLGANRGDTVEKYLELFPAATIYAFEPFPDSFQILQDRYRDNPRVNCYALAISNLSEERMFYVNKNVDTNSLLKPQKSGLSSDAQVTNKNQISVNTISLDEFCTTNRVLSIDILKMDIQGGELAALTGAKNLLNNHQIGLIYSETYFIEQYEQQPLFHDMSKMLYNYRYVLQDVYNPIYGQGNLAWCDVIFVQQN
jgi:FkbM family methyltransferase